jgi:hypothetical protein
MLTFITIFLGGHIRPSICPGLERWPLAVDGEAGNLCGGDGDHAIG